MNEFLSSLKADLLDRRLLPFAGVALAALIAAIAYVALGGAGSSTPSVPPAPGVSPAGAGISVSAADSSAEKAVAETTDGFKQQRKGGSRNPFTPLPGKTSVGVSTPAPASTGSSSSGSGGESKSSGGSSEETKEAAKKPNKPKTVYHVTISFGSLAPDPITGEVILEPFVNLKLFTPLPNSKQPLLVFRGVTAGGKAATFTVVGETILNGNGTCLPSAFQCHALDLRPGQAEQLEYLAPGASAAVSYELRVVSITAVKASKSSAHTARAGDSAAWGKSQAGWEVLHKAGLLAIPDLRQSSETGVLVFASHSGAHISRHGPRIGR